MGKANQYTRITSYSHIVMKIAIEYKPYPNETLSSWLIRNSFANGTDPKSFALSIFKQNSTWYKDFDRFIPSDLKDKLSKVVYLSKDEITSLTLEPLIDELALYPKNNPYKKWYFVLPMGLKGFVRTSGAYFCPDCLKNTKVAYLKQEWKFAWSIACSIHKKLLILRCQQCDNIFSPHKLSYLQPHIYLCSSCGYDLRESKTEDVDEKVLLFQNTLNQIAFNNAPITFPFLTQDRKDLFSTLHILLAFFAKVSKYNYHASLLNSLTIPSYTVITKNNATFNRKTTRDREYLLLACSKLFQLSVHEIIDLLKEHNISKQRFLFTYKNLSPSIESIVQELPDSSMIGKKKKKRTSKSTRVISPKTPSQVDALFKEIEQFLSILSSNGYKLSIHTHYGTALKQDDK